MKKVFLHRNQRGSLNLEMSLIIGLVVVAVVVSLSAAGAGISNLYNYDAAVIEAGGPVGDLAMVVTDTDGTPLAGATVTTVPIGGNASNSSGLIETAFANKSVTQVSDANGNVFFKYILAGDTKIIVEKPGFEPAETTAEIKPKEVVEETVKLIPKVTVSFDLNGGLGFAPDAKELLKGESFVLPDSSGITAPVNVPQLNSSLTPFVFSGWSTSQSGGSVVAPGTSQAVTSSSTFFARYVNKSVVNGEVSTRWDSSSGWNVLMYAREQSNGSRYELSVWWDETDNEEGWTLRFRNGSGVYTTLAEWKGWMTSINPKLRISGTTLTVSGVPGGRSMTHTGLSAGGQWRVVSGSAANISFVELP